MTVVGSDQGEIRSGDTIKGREGLVSVLNLRHEVEQRLATGAGFNNSSTRHSPLIVDKEFGKDSPAFFSALDNKETLTSVMIEWYRFDPSGIETLFYKIRLENAILVKVESSSPISWRGDPHNMKFIESYSFAYETIDWSWGPDGASAYKAKWNRARNAET